MYGLLLDYPEACGYSGLICVYHKHTYEIFQSQNREALSFYIGTSCLNIDKHFTSKGYGLVLEEGSAEAVFTTISLQDKGLGTIIIGQSG